MFNTASKLLLGMIGIALFAAVFAIIVAGGAYVTMRIIIHIITLIREEL